MGYSLQNNELNLAFEIPEETTLNTGFSNSFIDSVKKANKLPISLGEIYYSSDIWDFSPYIVINTSKHTLRIPFNNVPQPFCDDLKNFALLKIIDNKEKIQTIRGRVLSLRNFFNYSYNHHYYSVEEIPSSLIKKYISELRKEKNELRIFELKKNIKSFYVTYSSNFKDILNDELTKFLDEGNTALNNAIRRQNKTPDIPAEYFDRLLSALITMMRDISLNVDYRAIACVHIIESQTGLRINEVLNLDVNALKTITIFNGEESNYLTYNTWKRENGNNVFTKEITYINQLAKEAFLTLKEIHHEKRERFHLSFLYMGSERRNKPDDFPLDYGDYNRDEEHFYIQLNTLVPTINLNPSDYPDLHTIKSHNSIDPNGNSSEKIRTITHPSHVQYRVHCCTELANQGVPLQYVQRFMGHLSNEMAGYYVRPKDTIQEDIEYSNRILKDIVTGNARLLGDNKGLKDKIDEFISENHLSVSRNLDEICQMLSEKIPIRQKLGGVCIKSSILRDCSIDAKTNEFYCAYGVCPNLFHFYYMVDISYRQAKELTESIRINSERGHIKQVQKEKNMRTTIVKTKLIPEIDELKKTVETRGIDIVFKEHPEVQPIIENLDYIEKEIKEWITMK